MIVKLVANNKANVNASLQVKIQPYFTFSSRLLPLKLQ